MRLRHRSPNGLKNPDTGPPLLVQVVGYTHENRPLIKSAIIIAGSDPGKSWKTLEAVGQIPKEAVTLRLMVISRSNGGDYQISELDAVQVERPLWVSILLVSLTGGWLTWIFLILRQNSHQSFRPRASTVFATLWIFSWAFLLVFPRPVELPRPFFQTYQTSKVTPSTQAQEWSAANVLETPKPPKTPATPKPPNTPPVPNLPKDPVQTSPPPTNPEATPRPEIVTKPAPKYLPPALEKSNPLIRLRQWFKTLKGGRFLLHFGVMGSFAGVLFLLISVRRAWPAIIAVALGAELIPWILIGTVDQDDLWDLLAYALAAGIAALIARRLRRVTE
ncbi:hypothetical protein V2O64_23260 [Verrucomicrobiaceae bacterium 227]